MKGATGALPPTTTLAHQPLALLFKQFPWRGNCPARSKTFPFCMLHQGSQWHTKAGLLMPSNSPEGQTASHVVKPPSFKCHLEAPNDMQTWGASHLANPYKGKLPGTRQGLCPSLCVTQRFWEKCDGRVPPPFACLLELWVMHGIRVLLLCTLSAPVNGPTK